MSKTYTLTEKQISTIVQARMQKCMSDIEKRIQECAEALVKDLVKGTATESKAKAKPKTKGKEKVSKGGLKEQIQKVVNAKKARTQSYYDVKVGRAYVVSKAKKKSHDFFELGEEDDKLYIMGEKGGSDLKKALKELGFEGAEPMKFEEEKKALPKKKPAKPAKKIPKKKVPPRDPVILKIEIDEDLKLAKDSDGCLYIPSKKGGKLDKPLAFAKLNARKKPAKLSKKDIQGLEKRSIKLWHLEKKKPVPGAKEIGEILENWRAMTFPEADSDSEDSEGEVESEAEDSDSEDSEGESEEEEEEDSEGEEEEEVESEGEDSESEDEEKTEEMVSEAEDSDSEDSDTEDLESGESDGDVIDLNEKALEETIEPEVEVSKEEFKKYLEFLRDNKVISNVEEDAEEMGMSKVKLEEIIAKREDLNEQYPDLEQKVRREGEKGRKKLPQKKGRVLDVN